ncbi:uncharacterized protein ISCGN_020376 [Ixodes scapularis]
MGAPASATPEFDSALEATLIQMVEDRPLIWDVTHPSYHKKTTKEKAFRDIAIALGFDGNVEKVKNKWANMRSQYQRENRKVKDSSRSGAGADDIFVRKWAHYKKMRFLSAGAPEAQSESTLETSQEEVDDSLELIYEPSEEAVQSAPPPSKKNCRRTEEAAPNRAVLLQAAVDSLNAAKEPPQPDECRSFGVMMECCARSIPRGADRQMAMLAAHRIMVENSIAASLVVVPEGEN